MRKDEYIYVFKEGELPYKYLNGTKPSIKANRFYLNTIPYRSWKPNDLDKYRDLNDWTDNKLISPY